MPFNRNVTFHLVQTFSAVLVRLIAEIRLDGLLSDSIFSIMRYDLDMLNEFCRKIGLHSRVTDNATLEIMLGGEAVLRFENAERDEDCMIRFAGTPWHTHGDQTFSNHDGYFVELDPLNLLSGLRSGDVLLCEQEVSGSIADRWLVHKIFNDELEYLMPDERLIMRRAHCADGAASG